MVMDSKQLLQLEKKWGSKEMMSLFEREIRRLLQEEERFGDFKDEDDLADYQASLKNPKNYF